MQSDATAYHEPRHDVGDTERTAGPRSGEHRPHSACVMASRTGRRRHHTARVTSLRSARHRGWLVLLVLTVSQATSAAQTVDVAPVHLGPGAMTRTRDGRLVPLQQVIAGRALRDSDGSPLAGARVRVTWAYWVGCPTGCLEGAPTGTAITDAQGRFRFVIADQVNAVRLEVLPTETTTLVEFRPILGRSGMDPEDLELRAGLGGCVEGRVVDRFGQGVAESLVTASHEDRELCTTTSDAFGRFQFAQLPRSFSLSVSKPGRAPLEVVSGSVAPGGFVGDVELPLHESRSLCGRIVDDTGVPVVGARIVVFHDVDERTDAGGFHRQRLFVRAEISDERGGFCFEGLPRLPIGVQSWVPDYLRWSAQLDELATHLDIRLGRGITVVGTVLAADGSPAEDVEVEVTARTQRRTDATGRFTLRGLEPDRVHELIVTAPGAALAVVPVDPAAPGHRLPVCEVEVRLEPALALAGLVLDADGHPLANTRVQARGDRLAGWGQPRSWEELAGTGCVYTNREGRFRIDGLHAGLYTVVIGAGREGGHAVTARAGDETLELQRPPKGTTPMLIVQGHVTDAETSAPIRTFHVRPYSFSTDVASFGHDVESPTGAFQAGPMPARMEFLEVLAEGYVTGHVHLANGMGGALIADLALEREVPTRVRVCDANGQPVPGARLSVDAANGPVRGVIDGAAVDGVVDDLGEALLRKLPEGRVLVTIWVPRRDPTTSGLAYRALPIHVDRERPPEQVVELIVERP